jgi:hypothetical protein
MLRRRSWCGNRFWLMEMVRGVIEVQNAGWGNNPKNLKPEPTGMSASVGTAESLVIRIKTEIFPEQYPKECICPGCKNVTSEIISRTTGAGNDGGYFLRTGSGRLHIVIPK